MTSPDLEPTLQDKARQRFLEESPELDIESTDVRKLVQELRIRQIELEMQNEELRQARQRLDEIASQYSDFYDFAPVGYLTVDKNIVIRRMNLTAATMLGITRDQLIGKPLSTRVPAAYHPTLNYQVRAVLAHKEPPPCELEISRPDGKRLWVTLSSSLDHGVEEPLCRATLTDVSALKEAEQALRESETTLRGVLQTVPVGIGTLINRNFAWINEHLAQMTGYARAELVGAPARMLYTSEAEYDRVGHLNYAELDIRGGLAIETRWRRKNGQLIDILLTSTALARNDPAGGVMFAALDISARNKALAALREREEKYRLLADNTVDCIWLTDMELRFEYINPAIHPMLGYRPEEWLGSRLSDHCPAQDIDRISALLAAEIGRGGAAGGITLETTLFHKDGRRVATEITGKILFDEHHEPVRLQGVARDISERKKAEEEIRKFKMLAESATYGVLIADLAGTITYTNAAFAAMHGYDPQELIGSSLAIVQPKDKHQPVPWAWQPDEFGARERVHERKDGTEFDVLLNCTLVHDAAGGPSFLAVTATDITEIKSLEAQLRQAQKMEAIGHLAGGVAHDFNNLLTVILNRADFIQDALPPFSIYRDDVREIIDAAMRGAALTRQLLAFSSRQYLTVKALDIGGVIRNVEKMLKRLIGEDIQLSIRLDPQPCLVLADAGQLEQVMMNLAVNARDAMPQGGILSIETRPVRIGPQDINIRTEPDKPVPGHYIALSVTDTGVGMDKSLQAQIFDPFFTTKGIGRGTGLGLSTVYGIVKQHKGFIRVYSEPGKGSTFRVFLPVHNGSAAESEQTEQAVRLTGGQETVLLVEDEPAVRRVSAKMLRGLGYQVLEAEDGKTALEILRRQGETVDLLLTDVVMPEMDGRQLAEQAAGLRPGIKVIYTSGYPEAHLKLRNAWVTDHPLLQKPFLVSELASSIRKVLDSG